MLKLLCIFLLSISCLSAKVTLGIDRLLEEKEFKEVLKGKKVGLITNHTAINDKIRTTADLLKEDRDIKLIALFAPEHGITGLVHAGEDVEHSKDKDGLPIHSLHGATRRPTEKMLKGVDVLIFDIQDIGSRSYTYISTLFYIMEEAAKKKIKVIVLDRPNPLGGQCVDGLMLEPKWRSFVGYINVPYCHGMTVGELAQFFNQEYKIKCDLVVIPMKGWTRSMTFQDTELTWIPTSPQIPEADSPFFYPTTGLIGELQIANIGVGYTLPFKVVGAPWIDATKFAKSLNEQNFPGVHFQPTHYRPFFGTYKDKDCHGVLIIIKNKKTFKPVETQYLILGILKSLYPTQFKNALKEQESRKDMFCKVNGTEEVFRILKEDTYTVYKLRKMCQQARKEFLVTRKPYLLYD